MYTKSHFRDSLKRKKHVYLYEESETGVPFVIH